MADRAAYWRDVMERQARGGLSIREFCKREKVSTASFYGWRRRLKSTAEEQAGGPAFVAVSIARDSTAVGFIEIVLPEGVTVRVPAGMDRRTIVDVLAAMEAAS